MQLQDKFINQAVECIRAGGVIAFPTETTYGLGCDPRNAQAVQSIFQIKGRDHVKPLLLVAGSLAQVERVAMLSSTVKKIINTHWPGPLTLVLPVRQDAELVEGVICDNEIAVRFSSSLIVQALTQSFDFPIVATSANKTGEPESRSAQDVQAYDLNVDYIIDGGQLVDSKPSTVARINETGEIEIIRAGAIHIDSL